MRPGLKTLGLSVALVAAAAGLTLAWLEFAPRRTPRDQPALTTLDAAAFPALRETFNAGAGGLRIVALFSPT